LTWFPEISPGKQKDIIVVTYTHGAMALGKKWQQTIQLTKPREWEKWTRNA